MLSSLLALFCKFCGCPELYISKLSWSDLHLHKRESQCLLKFCALNSFPASPYFWLWFFYLYVLITNIYVCCGSHLID